MSSGRSVTPFTPDIVKLAYFDAHDDMARLQRDPAHARLEQEFYPAAVTESIWLIAETQPVSLPRVRTAVERLPVSPGCENVDPAFRRRRSSS